MQSVFLLICVKGEGIVHGALVQTMVSAKTLVQGLLETCHVQLKYAIIFIFTYQILGESDLFDVNLAKYIMITIGEFS